MTKNCAQARVIIRSVKVHKSESYGIFAEPGSSAEWELTFTVAGQQAVQRHDNVKNGAELLIDLPFLVDIGSRESIRIYVSGVEIDDSSANDALPSAQYDIIPAENWEDGQTFQMSASAGDYSYTVEFNIRCALARIEQGLTIDQPYYRIIAACSQKCLDIPLEHLNENGAKVQQWKCYFGDNQQFRIEAFGEYYRIIAKCSNKCLDIPSDHLNENGAKVQQWECYNGINQMFKIEEVGDHFRIIAACSNKCLDIPSDHLDENGAKVQQWECYNGINQLFKIVNPSNGRSFKLNSI